jgi:hypothetical protein
MRRNAIGHGLRGSAFLALAATATAVSGQSQTNVPVPPRGAGSFGMTYQQIDISERELIVLRENFGEVTLRGIYFEFDYGLTDRLAMTLTLPLKSNRYVGDKPHDPTLLANDHGEEFLDNGDYHTNWGDFGVDFRWQWRATDRFAITPFMGYYTPSNDYPLFTETQAGRAQWRVDVGFNMAGRLGPPARNLYWQTGYAFSYVEKTRPTDAEAMRVNRSEASFEVGWSATPRFQPYLTLAYYVTHGGLELPEFTGLFVSDQFYYHDQLLPWEQKTWAVGARYNLSALSGLSMSYGRSSDVEFGHFYEPAVSFSFNRSFEPQRARAR